MIKLYFVEYNDGQFKASGNVFTVQETLACHILFDELVVTLKSRSKYNPDIVFNPDHFCVHEIYPKVLNFSWGSVE